eukprot:CAMPEP_0116041068 /NCGR_PEP_ID=MMETSP0321-20121206/24783_1 /TAXON_ID=163516 /ORGANISM="Leptocylindrus danicus var. danicus, Strain B650" /LENGTH=145 /DNA_ID=CAMNT_0003521101 /DNA_START=60 /DNA_END=498 /DNA_ORIENTATION=+
MNHLQQTIPQLPINILVTFYESAQSPSITIEEGDEKNWRVKVKPRLRWRMLMFVEMVLMQSIPNSYRENNRNQLLEVAYIIEKTMFAMVKHVKEYINLVSFLEGLSRRVGFMFGELCVRIKTGLHPLPDFANSTYKDKKSGSAGA